MTVGVLGNREPRKSATLRDDIVTALRDVHLTAVDAHDRSPGVVLVSAFLVVPSAAGRALGSTLTSVVGYAMLTGVLGVSLGFLVAHRFEWPEGASIVLILALLFAVAIGGRRLRRA